MIDSIIKSARAIVEFLVILLSYRQIFNANIIKNKLKLGIAGVLMGVCYFINAYFELNIFYTIIGTVYAIVVPLFLLEGNKKKWLSLYPTLMLMTAMTSMCLSYAIATILDITVMDVYYNTMLSFIVDAIFLAVLLLDYLYKKTNTKHRRVLWF